MRRTLFLTGRLSAAWVLSTTVSALASSPAPLPRKAPELKISEVSGNTTLLSSLKGRVVVMEFLFVQSDHCVRVAKTLDKLNRDLGPSGIQAIGIAFDPPNAPNSGGILIPALVDYLKLSYPVGYATKAEVDDFLGRSGQEVLNIPQIVVTDGAGMIRATSGGAGGDPKLESEDSLRALLQGLLKESESRTGGK